jgi:tetratricopeptide (TPR) repeat protein
MHASPLVQQIETFKSMLPDHPVQAIAFLQSQMERLPKDDPWICWCYYQIGMVMYRNNRDYAGALDAFNKSLEYPETTPGQHLQAEQMKMECLNSLHRYQEAATTANLIRKVPAPESLRKLIVPNALFMEAQLREKSDTGDGKQRALAEQVYKDALSDTNVTGLIKPDDLYKLEEGSLRERVQNLVTLNKTNEAADVCKDFLRHHPNSYYAPLIALDLKRIESGRVALSVAELKDISSKYDLNSGAGVHVTYELAVSESLEGRRQDAIKYAQKVISLKVPPKDPMPVSLGLVSEAINVRTFAYLREGETNEALKSAAALDSNYVNEVRRAISNSAAFQNSRDIDKLYLPSEHNMVLVRLALGSFAIISAVVLILLLSRNKSIRY